MSVPGNLYTPTIRKTRGGDYLIEQSLLFNDDDSAYLTRTPGTAGNRKTWTFSVWVKGLEIAQNNGIFIATDNTSTSMWGIRYTGSNNGTFEVLNYPGSLNSQLRFAGVIRDPSAWYHLVVAFDTTQGTSSNRIKMYLNGTQLTAFDASTYPALNYDGQINNTVLHTLGTSIWASQYMDGAMALPILVDGAALDATSFGEEDDDGYWNPIEFAGTATVSWTENLSIDDHASKPSTGTASASSEANASSAAEHAFNEVTSGGTNVGWQSSSAGSQWLQFQYDTAQTIKAYYVVGHVAAWSLANRAPNSWTIVGSNTGAFSGEEVTIDTVSGESGWSDQEVRWFNCSDNDTAYTYYRMNISSNNGGTLDSVIEWNMFGQNDTGTGFGTNGFALDFADTAAFGADVKTNTNTMTPTFEAQYYDTSNLTTYTFSACDLGTADADRSIIVAVGAGRVSAGSRTVSSLTIGGVSATFAGRKQTANLNANEIWYAKVPTGATGDVVVTFNAGMVGCGIGIWSVLNLGPVQDVQGDNTTGSVASQSVSIGGGESAFAVFNVYDEGTVSAVSWSTATERYEDLSNESGTNNLTGADYAFSSAANATTVTATYTGTGGNDGSLLGVTFGKPNDSFYKALNFTAADQLSDSPTDSADDGFGNRPTLNPNDKSTSGTFTFSNGNRTVTQTGSDVKNAFCTMSLPTTGKIYFECYWSSVSGDPSMGITTTPIWTANAWKGAVNGIDTADADKWLWNGDNFFDETSSTSYSGFGPDAAAYEKWAIDLDTGKVWSGNSNNGWANSGDPAAGTGELATIGATELASGLVVFIRLRLSVVGTVNFGQVAFNETPPTGFSGWSTADFAAPTIADPSDYFNTVLWSGTGAEQAITGVGFQPDFVWHKGRGPTAYSHGLWDSVRGANKWLASDTTAAESTTTQSLKSFDSDGFTVGTDTFINNSGSSNIYVAWCWKAGTTFNGTSNRSKAYVTNYNATAGFSIITYTGSSSSGFQTLNHKLGVAPKMVIIKNRGRAGTNWPVYHTSCDIAANKAVFLNTTASQAVDSTLFNATFESTNIYVNSSNDTNLESDTYVAYCWAEVEGFSKFGSYTGNGSADGPFVYCGFRPAFVIHKRIDSGSEWGMWDTKRSLYNPVEKSLWPHSNTAEMDPEPTGGFDAVSNGFKVRTSEAWVNTSGGTYIFAAFAENPFQGDDGYTQARAR